MWTSAPALLDPLPPSPSHPSRVPQSSGLISLCLVAASHRLSDLHVVAYVMVGSCHHYFKCSPRIRFWVNICSVNLCICLCIYLCIYLSIDHFSSVQLLSCVWLSAACQASLSLTNSRRPPKPMSIESVMPSNHLTAVVPFSSCPQYFPAPGSFPVSQLFASGGQSIGDSAWTSVLPVNTQHWSPSIYHLFPVLRIINIQLQRYKYLETRGQIVVVCRTAFV